MRAARLSVVPPGWRHAACRCAEPEHPGRFPTATA